MARLNFSHGSQGLKVDHPQIIAETPVGVPILLADGQIELQVEGKTDKELNCWVVVGGVLRSHAGINFPRHSLSVPALTAKNREDIRFGIKMGVDFIALSYVRSPQDVLVARGDLGVEVPLERVPFIQKQIIATANRVGKPVITATQMLLSMVDHSRLPGPRPPTWPMPSWTALMR